MKKEMFEELLSSVREMGAIMRGERPAARVTEFSGREVKAIRGKGGWHPPGTAKKSAVGG